MNKEKITSRIEELYQSNKSKKFILHLVRGYFPLDKVSKVIDFEEGQKRKCQLTYNKLISESEVLEIINKEGFAEELVDTIKYPLYGEEKKWNPLSYKVGKKTLAFIGDKTNSCLSQFAIDCLFEWITTKITEGDKTIKWTLEKEKEDKKDVKIVRDPKKLKRATSGLDTESMLKLEQLKNKFKK